MADTHTTNASAAGRKEAPMSLSPSTLARLGIRPEWAAGRKAATILAAAGHPGYGEAFAKKALARIEAGASSHQAVYGLMGR